MYPCLSKVRQINKFFSDWSTGEVKHTFSKLIHQSLLVYHGANNEYVSFVHHLPHTLDFYEPCILAIDTMITIRSKSVVWFNRDMYPLDITFATTDNRIYDIAVFDEFWMAKYSIIKRTRSQNIPAGEEDVIDHIAVVPNTDIAQQVAPLGFTLFAQVDPRTGHVDFFEITA